MNASRDAPAMEVDFYRNPTILSRLILNQKFQSAWKRLKVHPEEAAIWVCSKRNPYKTESAMNLLHQKWLASSSRTGYSVGDSDVDDSRSITSMSSVSSSRSTASRRLVKPSQLEYSIRQLPLHAACEQLLRTSENKQIRLELEQLITSLIVAYPDGAAQVDHEGRLPLHECLWHNVGNEVITMLLIAYPASLHVKDKFGRTPVELNRFRSGESKHKVQKMLLRGQPFWENARKEAMEQMKASISHSSTDLSSGNEVKASGSMTPPSPLTSSSLGLQGVLEDVAAEMKATSPSTKTLPQKSRSKLVEPITWIKLERRAIHLEQLLNEMYEKNYELNELVHELEEAKQALAIQNDVLQRSTISDKTELLKENDELKEKTADLQELLLKKALADDESTRSAPEMEVWEHVEQQNQRLKEELDVLTATNHSHQLKIDRLEMAIHSLREKMTTMESHEQSGRASENDHEDEYDHLRVAYDGLIDALKDGSHLATERYLASKIVDLEEQLAETHNAADNDILGTKEENQRLLRENQVLHQRILDLQGQHGLGKPTNGSFNSSASSFSPQRSHATPSIPSLARSSVTSAGASSAETENLDDIFFQASAMYDPSTLKSPPIGVRDKQGRNSASYENTRKISFQDSPEILPVLPTRSQSMLSHDTATSSSGTSGYQSDVEDLEEIIAEAARMYGKPLEDDLVNVLRKVSVNSSSTTKSGSNQTLQRAQLRHQSSSVIRDDLDSILEEAQRMYGKQIPVAFVDALRKASNQSNLSSSGDETSAITQDFALMQNYAESDDDATGRDDTYDPLIRVIREAETMYGGSLPPEWVESLRQLSMGDRDGESTIVSDTNSFITADSKLNQDDISSIIREAERIYGKPLTSSRGQTVESVTGHSAASSLVPQPDPPRRKISDITMSVDHSTLATIETDTVASAFDMFLKETEESYGQPIPQDIVHALRAASFTLSQDGGIPDINHVLQEAERMIGRELRADLKEIIRIVAIEEDATPTVGFQDDDLDTVLREAERLYGQRLSADVINAWKATSVTDMDSHMPSIAEDSNPEDEEFADTWTAREASSGSTGDLAPRRQATYS